MRKPLRWCVLAILIVLWPAGPAAAAPWDECAGGLDAGDEWQFAEPLAPGVRCQGRLEHGDSSDWYFVQVPAGSLRARINVQVCPQLFLETIVTVYYNPSHQEFLVNGPGIEMGRSAWNGFGSCDEVSAEHSGLETLEGGRWYIDVSIGDGSGAYDIAILARAGLKVM